MLSGRGHIINAPVSSLFAVGKLGAKTTITTLIALFEAGVVAELSAPQDSSSESCMLTPQYDEARTSPLPHEELEII